MSEDICGWHNLGGERCIWGQRPELLLKSYTAQDSPPTQRITRSKMLMIPKQRNPGQPEQAERNHHEAPILSCRFSESCGGKTMHQTQPTNDAFFLGS